MSDTDSDSDCKPLDDPTSFSSSKPSKSSSVADVFAVNNAVPLVLSNLLQTRKTAPHIDPDVQMELNAMMGNTTDSFRMESTERQTGSPRNGLTTKRATDTQHQRFGLVDGFSSGKTTTLKMLPAKASPIDQTAKLELESILQKPALTSEDKYRVLDARDKLIRLTTSSTSDISRAALTKGTCPDMCPEKERLMREATHHVATFELEDNSRHLMRHTHALKQYSRSSADQQIPLAHELRPEPVLQMTMQFLLHYIVDLCESTDTNLADWFHFVWDRTRSIRKDISQQDLCSIGAVNLVEQCARLHIHCAGRLVAEEPQVFSSKINSENLTKCLQSLKYLYHDLQLRSVRCSNEAEFRAYVVLLNLNDCQFFWEVKQLPHTILHSPEIQFAIKVYLALESNNYVRFFRLVRETTYMNACILMRYFTQMRVIALEMMLKTYSPRSTVFMEISHWQYVLAFEDFEQTAQFFEYYGLHCDRDTDRLFLNRVAFVYPDIPFMLERAIYLVEHKRSCSVGESIHGSPLDHFEAQFNKYEPHDSFDDRGYLYAEAWTADDQNYSSPSTPKTRVIPSPVSRASTPTPTSSPRPPSPRPPPSELSANTKQFFKVPLLPPSKSPGQPKLSPKVNIRSDTTTEGTLKLGESIFTGNKRPPFAEDEHNRMSDSDNRKIFATSTLVERPSTAFGFKFSLDVGSTSSSVVETGSHRHPFSLNLDPFSTNQTIFGGLPEPPSTTDKFTFSSASEATTDSTPITPVLSSSMYKEHAENHQLMKETQAHCLALTDTLITNYVEEETAIIAHQVEAQRKVAQSELINAVADETLEEIIQEHIAYELDATLKDVLRMATQCNTAKYFARWRHLVRLRTERRTRIENTPIWIEPERTRAEMSVPQHQINLSERLRYRQGVAPPIRIPKPTQRLIDVCSVVSAANLNSRSNHYWKCLFSIPGDHPPESTRLFNWISAIIQRRCQPSTNVFFAEELRKPDGTTIVCLRLLQGSQMIDHTIGAKATPDQLKGSHSILFFESSTESQQEYDTRRSRLLHLNLPIEYVSHPPTRHSTLKALKNLAQHALLPSNLISTDELHVQRTTDFLLQTLGDQFWHSIRQSAASNPGLQQAMRDPRSVVIIYNEAIRRLIEITSEDHSDHPEIPPELRRFVPALPVDVPSTLEYFPEDWKNPTRSQKLVDFLNQLQLRTPDHFISANTDELKNHIHTYCQSQTDKNIADQITSTIFANFHTAADIIIEFARIGPAMLSYARLSQQFTKHANIIPSHIVYSAQKLRHFCQQPWWLTFDESPVHDVRIHSVTKTNSPISMHRSTALLDKSEMDALVARTTSLLRNADTKIQQRRLEIELAHRKRIEGAAQLDQHLRRYDCVMLRQKRIISDDDDLQAIDERRRSRNNNENQEPATSKKPRLSNNPASATVVPGVADILGMRSFVWQCYAE